MYYARFKGIDNSDIAEFKTKEERDNWVNFQDQFSKDFNTNLDNCVFEREVLTDDNIIHSVTNNKHIKTAQDEFLPYIKWYLKSVA